MAEWLKSADVINMFNHLIISLLCLGLIPFPHGAHVKQAIKFCLRVWQVVFLLVLPFSPHLLICTFHMSLNYLEMHVKLNQDKKLYFQCVYLNMLFSRGG